ncbi:MAG: glycosyltransferase family 4 protein [Candidatus Saccharicenans sp.]
MSKEQSGKSTKQNLWIVSELFYPSEASTGYILTNLAVGFKTEYNVGVLTAINEKNKQPIFEIYKGVKIYRGFTTKFNKNNLFLRLINAISFNVSIFFKAFQKFSKNDLVLAVTNPPVLPYFALLIAKLKKGKFIIVVHDVYPDLTAVLGLLKRPSLIFRVWTHLNKILFAWSDLIFVLSEDMKELICDRFNSYGLEKKIHVVPNWAEIEIINPDVKENNDLLKTYGLKDKFIVQYAGNFGRPNDIETIIEAAKMLKDYDDIVFLFAGDGAKKKFVEQEKKRWKLQNLILLGSYSRKDQQQILNASDVSLIALIKGMKGISMPSRFYNILASGRPVIAIIDGDMEVASLIKKKNIGWVVSPGDHNALVRAILEARADHYLLQKGQKARLLAEKYYSYDKILSIYKEALSKIHA